MIEGWVDDEPMDGQIKESNWKKRWVDKCINVRMDEWMEGEVYFHNSSTSTQKNKHKIQGSLRKEARVQ